MNEENKDKAKLDKAKNVKKKYPSWRTPVKVMAWVVMAVVLFVVGLLVAAFSILSPERLTPIVTSIANNNLNADVSIGRVELSMSGTAPYLMLNIDKLGIYSRDMRKLDAETREMLPEFADTLVTVNKISGGINIAALAGNRIELRDIVIDAPRANLVVLDQETTNFSIIPPSEDTTAIDIAGLPELVINRFEITNPGPVRYYDVETGTSLVAEFDSISLVGDKAPMYTLNFQTNLESPILTDYFNFEDLQFGLRGNLRWSQKQPYHIALDEFEFKMSMLAGTISTDMDFTDEFIVNSLDLKLQPIDIYKLIHVLPDEMAEDYMLEYGIPYSLYSELQTNISLQIAAKLLEPYNTAKDALPRIEASLLIPDSYLKWQQLDLRSLKALVRLTLPDDNLDNATVDVDYFDMSGPATDIHLKGTFTNLLTDPTFDCDVATQTQLTRLPVQLKKLFGGTVEGKVTADAHIKGSTSMFTPEGFQHLLVEGDVGLRDFYWLAYDTVNMVQVDRALFKFGTQRRVASAAGTSAPLLSASIELDSATVLMNNSLMGIKDAKLSLAASNSRRVDRLAVHPMGGGIKLGRFNFRSLSDSAVFRLRDVDGTAIIQPIDNNMHRPEFIFKLGMARLMAGDNTTRFMLNKAQLDFSARRKPETERQKRIRHSADSLLRRQPELTPDSAIAIAERLHRRTGGRRSRVHTEMVDSLSEVIDFGTTKTLRRLLTRWELNGTLISNRARMFTPYFPLRNRLSNIDVSFNNDTLRLNSVKYKAGRSDLLVSGEITDLSRALTSRRQRVPLKLRFLSISDTIDINQLAHTTFAGSAYAQNQNKDIVFTGDSENALDSVLNLQMAESSNVGALLVPRNVDLEVRCYARNVMYSDLMLRDMSGSLLAYDGAVNLRRLAARSDVGQINLSALYMGSNLDSLNFGFGMQIDDFNLHKFLDVVPAIDSVMPVLRDFSGVISADVACTSPLDRNMDFKLDQMNAAIKIGGKELVLIDPATFKSLSKWLLFKDKNRNVIDSMAVQMSVDKGMLQIYPFIFNIDRYRLGVQGHNDLAMNFDYHVAVLKSPLPFKFGINIKGNPDKFKIRLGGAKFNEKTPLQQVAFVDTTRVNLLRQIENVFRRGVRGADKSSLRLDRSPSLVGMNLTETALTPNDSLELYRNGMIAEPPKSIPLTDDELKKDKKQKKDAGKKSAPTTAEHSDAAIKPKES